MCRTRKKRPGEALIVSPADLRGTKPGCGFCRSEASVAPGRRGCQGNCGLLAAGQHLAQFFTMRLEVGHG